MCTINIGQFYGGLVGAAFWIFAGIWYLYVRPRSLRRQIDCGDVDAFHGHAKLRKAPLLAYMFLLIAVADVIGTLGYVGASEIPRSSSHYLGEFLSRCSS